MTGGIGQDAFGVDLKLIVIGPLRTGGDEEFHHVVIIQTRVIALGHLGLDLLRVRLRAADGDVEKPVVVGNGKTGIPLGWLTRAEFGEALLPWGRPPNEVDQIAIDHGCLARPRRGHRRRRGVERGGGCEEEGGERGDEGVHK